MFDAIRRQIASWIAPETRTLGISPRVDPSFFGGVYGRPTQSGVPINEGSALGISAFWRGVNLYAGTISSLPLEVVEKDARGGFRPAPDHSLYGLLSARPNGTTTRLHLWESLISHALTFRGGFAEIEWSAGNRRPLGLHIMDPREVRPIFNDDRTVQYRIDGKGTLLDSSDVIHIRGLGFNGIEGYGLVDLARESLGIAKAQMIHEGSVFGNGAQAGGVLEMPGSLDPQKQAQFRDDWNKVHQGPTKSNKVGILTGGAKWVQTNFSPADAELILSRSFSVGDVARFLGIPPHMLGLMDGATVGNAEQQALQFVKFTLRRWLKAIEQELEFKLFSAQETRRFAIRHDTKDLERGDIAARMGFYTGMFGLGAISPNQVALAEGLPPDKSPNADKRYLAVNNLAPLDAWDGKPKNEPNSGGVNDGVAPDAPASEEEAKEEE